MAANESKDGQTVSVSTRIPKDLAAQLQAVADKNDRSLSWVIAWVLKKWAAGEVK